MSCKCVYYCSRKCQKASWKNSTYHKAYNHKAECAVLTRCNARASGLSKAQEEAEIQAAKNKYETWLSKGFNRTAAALLGRGNDEHAAYLSELSPWLLFLLEFQSTFVDLEDEFGGLSPSRIAHWAVEVSSHLPEDRREGIHNSLILGRFDKALEECYEEVCEAGLRAEEEEMGGVLFGDAQVGAAGKDPETVTSEKAEGGPPAVGDHVVIKGLVSRTDLNGEVGDVTALDLARSRASVVIVKTGEVVNVKFGNLAPAAKRGAVMDGLTDSGK